MSKWNHSICADCWTQRNPGRSAHCAATPQKMTCCYCFSENSSGILVRGNPEETPCKGVHGIHFDPQATGVKDAVLDSEINVNTDLSQYVLRKDTLGRWLIVLHESEGHAWSGWRWVPIGGAVPLCSFESEEAGHAYAAQIGLVPALVLSDDEIKAIWFQVAKGVGSQGDFLRSLGDAVILADPENFPIIRKTAIFFIRKYQLESLAARPVAMLPIPEEKGGPELEKDTHS